MRFFNSRDRDVFLESLKKILRDSITITEDRYPFIQGITPSGVHLTCEITAEGNMWFVDVSNFFIQQFFSQVKAITHKEVATIVEVSATDARHLLGIPTIIMKPECSESHLDDEWVSITGMYEYIG